MTTTVACPHCNDSAAELWPTTGDFREYRCPKCGPFFVSCWNEERIENGHLDHNTVHLSPGRDGRQWLGLAGT
jgi:hypothetical protein